MSRSYGLRRVWPAETVSRQSSIDIVAIHGLGTQYPKTWLAHEDPHDPASRSVNWLQDEDMLPACFPNSSIWAYDWDSGYCDNASLETLLGHAQGFLLNVKSRLLAEGQIRPLIIVASCFGGLITMKAVKNAILCYEEFGVVLQSIIGIVFLASPLKGTSMKKALDWQLLISAIMGKQVSDTLYKDLDARTGVLQDLVYSFTLCANGIWRPEYRIPIFCFYETQRTKWFKGASRWKGWETVANLLERQGDILVPYESATLDGFPNKGLSANHPMMCKFRGPDDSNFQAVVVHLRKFVNESASIISKRMDRGHKPYSTLPRSVNPLFVGQKSVVEQIIAAMRGNSNSRRVFVITGPGGIGKSEVCLQVADNLLNEYWAIFWIDGSSRLTAEDGYIRAVAQFANEPRSKEEALRKLANVRHKWLLILDNADDTQLDYAELLPPERDVSVIITSRNPECSVFQTVGHVQLTGLDDQAAADLLLRTSEVEQTASELEHVKNLIRSLHGHPLAIRQAGAYIKLFCNSCNQYPGIFSTESTPLLTQGQSRHHHVHGTFVISIEALDLIDASDARDARDLLAFISRLHYSGLPLDLFKAVTNGFKSTHRDGGDLGAVTDIILESIPRWLHSCKQSWDNAHLHNAIWRLCSLGMVSVEQRRGLRCLSVHPLIHGWARNYFKTASTVGPDLLWLTTGTFLSLISQSKFRYTGWEMDLRPHLHSFLAVDVMPKVENCKTSTHATAVILFDCVKLLHATRDSSMGESILEILFSILDADQQTPTSELLPLYDLQAISEERCGHRASAKRLYEQIVALKEALLGPSDPDCLNSRHALAIAARGTGDIALASSELEEVLRRRKPLYHEYDPELLTTHLDLARVLILQGSLLLPIVHLEHVVRLCDTHLNTDDLLRLHSRHELARAYLKTANRPGLLDRSSEAVGILEDVRKVESSILSEDDSQRLSTLHALAKAYLQNGQTETAISILLQIIEIQKNCLAANHPTLLASLFELGRAYRINGQASDAIQVLQ
ncbi:hypothetical protein F4806DRAFT_482908 [Annulohypoxylon nitens]|nr:hypothetical protein F4806DRAFT_482908 [Annulohypoxylon nitens]